jgi:serine/threonine protein kinase
VCCGEHKGPYDDGEENEGYHDLVKKFHGIWNGLIMHGLPYLPAYTVCGTAMRFYLIMPDSTNALKVVPVDTFHFDLLNAVDRARVIRRAMNMASVFRILKDYSFRLHEPTTQVKRDDNDTRLLQVIRLQAHVDFYLDRVEKFPLGKNGGKLAPEEVYIAAAAVYRAIGIDVSITTERDNPDNEKVIYRPVLSQTLPLTMKQLRWALECILRFLVEFHTAGFVHRDIRFPNVLRTASGSWALVDFEMSAASDTISPRMERGHLPPESRTDDSTYSTAGDIWQVSRMVKTWSEVKKLGITDKSLLTLLNEMAAEEADKRPSAAAALNRLRLIA